jgi:hypothetical protein
MACLFTVHVGSIPSPFSSGAFLTPPLTNFPTLGCWADAATPAFSSCLVYLQFMWEVPLPHSPVEFSSHCQFYEISCSKDAGQVQPLLPSLTGLFIYSSLRDGPFPPLRHSAHPTLFATCLFCCCCCYSVCFLSLFFLGRGQSIQEAMLIWARVCCKSTTCRLAHLVVCISQASRKWHLAAWEPSWFIHLQRSGDAMCGLGVWRSQRFASSWWFFL